MKKGQRDRRMGATLALKYGAAPGGRAGRPQIASASFSAIMMVGALRLPVTTCGRLMGDARVWNAVGVYERSGTGVPDGAGCLHVSNPIEGAVYLNIGRKFDF